MPGLSLRALTFAVVLSLFMLIMVPTGYAASMAQPTSTAVTGPTLPPAPWDGLTGPTLPPAPWDGVTGPTLPPAPWDGLR